MAISLDNIALSLRIAQAVLSVLVLGLSGYVAHWWTGFYHGGSPSEVNFLIFNAVWSILVVGFLVIVPWRFATTLAHHKYVTLAVESTTATFWFAGFVALAVFLSGRVCYGHVCSAVQAADVFAAFTWIAFTGTTTLSVLHIFRTRGEGLDSRSGKPTPDMRFRQDV